MGERVETSDEGGTTRSGSTSSLNVEATLRLMDVADQLRSEQREHTELVGELESQTRDRIREHLLRLYEELDEAIDPALVDEAIDSFLVEQHRFRPPEPGLAVSLARVYVRRASIARRYGLPIASTLFALLLAGVIAWQVGRFASGRAERAVEESVASTQARHAALVRELEGLAGDPAIAELSETDRSGFERSVAQTRADLDRVGAFLSEYAPGGAPENGVTRDNYEAVERLVEEADQANSDAAVSLSTADALVAAPRRLAELAPESERLVAAIRALAREPRALEQAEAAYTEASAFVASGSVAQLETVVEQLRDLEAELSRAYRVVIEGGVWRYKDDEPGVRNYYLRVRALGEDGQAFAFRVTHEETGAIETVSEWAERVDKAVYDRVAADKQDNGLIDDDLFATKARGFVTVERAYPNLGQITRW